MLNKLGGVFRYENDNFMGAYFPFFPELLELLIAIVPYLGIFPLCFSGIGLFKRMEEISEENYLHLGLSMG